MVNQRQAINSYDLDGVVSIGITPRPEDIIITGRSYEEAPETYAYLQARGIDNAVFFNPLPFDLKTRELSGRHKARVLNELLECGVYIEKHFDDDEVQVAEIQRLVNIPVVQLVHNLSEKENVRHKEVE